MRGQHRGVPSEVQDQAFTWSPFPQAPFLDAPQEHRGPPVKGGEASGGFQQNSPHPLLANPSKEGVGRRLAHSSTPNQRGAFPTWAWHWNFPQ